MKPPKKFQGNKIQSQFSYPHTASCAFLLPFRLLLTLAVAEKNDKLAAPLRSGPGSGAVDYYQGFPPRTREQRPRRVRNTVFILGSRRQSA
jgi:hypothetical protein